MVDYKSVYNNVYSANIRSYKESKDCKQDTVKKWFSGKEGSVLDLGCGYGTYTRTVMRMGFDVLGVEVSDYCCKNHLKDIKHVNKDILTFLKENDKKFDWILFTDVIEHLEEDYIDLCLGLISKTAKCSLIGIANHSDIIDGVELHLIQEDPEWWKNKLELYFEKVCLVKDDCNRKDVLFYFECSGSK